MQARLSRPRLIEADAFPFEFLSAIADTKVGARRSIAQSTTFTNGGRTGSARSSSGESCWAALLPEGENLEDAFYQKHQFGQTSVLDPFMGSGTTVGEAHKLGCAVMGRDINPVACEVVRLALGPFDRPQLQDAFAQLAETVGERPNCSTRRQMTAGFCATCFTISGSSGSLAPTVIPPWTCSRASFHATPPDRKPEVRICSPGVVASSPRITETQRRNVPVARCTLIHTPVQLKARTPTCTVCSQIILHR